MDHFKLVPWSVDLGRFYCIHTHTNEAVLGVAALPSVNLTLYKEAAPKQVEPVAYNWSMLVGKCIYLIPCWFSESVAYMATAGFL